MDKKVNRDSAHMEATDRCSRQDAVPIPKTQMDIIIRSNPQSHLLSDSMDNHTVRIETITAVAKMIINTEEAMTIINKFKVIAIDLNLLPKMICTISIHQLVHQSLKTRLNDQQCKLISPWLKLQSKRTREENFKIKIIHRCNSIKDRTFQESHTVLNLQFKDLDFFFTG